MDDVPWKRSETDSPCVSICLMHPDAKICTGCLRTIDEISGWSAMTPDQRSAIKEALPSRADQLKKRKGGRSARMSR